MHTLRSFATRPRFANINRVVLNSIPIWPGTARSNRHTVTAGNDHDRKDRASWICDDMHCTMKRRIAVVLHNTVNQVLIVTVERNRSSLCFHYTGAGFDQTEDDESTAVVSERKNRLREGCLVIVRALQIEPILDLTIEVFSRIDQ